METTTSAPGLLSRIARLLRHRWWDERDVKRAMPDAALDRLQQRITDSERAHSGEIRICIEAGLPLSYLWRGASPRERAVAMFGKLRVWDTEDNNGVLIYLLLAERSVELVADRGVARRIAPQQWQSIVDGLSIALRSGQFEAGLNQAVTAVDALLREHFPVDPSIPNVNELPDRPYLR